MGKPPNASAALQSPPSRAAWIEIYVRADEWTVEESPPSRAAWIEILESRAFLRIKSSPPSRAAWIEIELLDQIDDMLIVAAFTGGVD